MRREIEALLAACNDDDLLRRHDHAACGAEQVRDQLTQLRQPGRIDVFAHASGGTAQAVEDQAAPGPLRKGSGIRPAQGEIVRQGATVGRVEPRRATAGIGQGEIDDAMVAGGTTERLRCPDGERVVGHPLGNEGADRRLRAEVTLLDEELVSLHHGVARDVELFAQLARAGNLASRAKPSATDQIVESPDDLCLQGMRTFQVNANRELHCVALLGGRRVPCTAARAWTVRLNTAPAPPPAAPSPPHASSPARAPRRAARGARYPSRARGDPRTAARARSCRPLRTDLSVRDATPQPTPTAPAQV